MFFSLASGAVTATEYLLTKTSFIEAMMSMIYLIVTPLPTGCFAICTTDLIRRDNFCKNICQIASQCCKLSFPVK